MELLEYFLHNPQAIDSLEGIARWRLREQTIDRSVDEVNEALSWLVERGFLLQESTRSASSVFYLNLEKVAEANRLLEKASAPARGHTD